MVKDFGRGARKRKPVAREPFTFTFLRDDVPEVHSFQARASADAIGLSVTLAAASKKPETAMPQILRTITQIMDNKDGTPNGWEAEVVQRPADADGPPVTGDDESELAVRKFRGPDGALHPFTEVDRFTAFEAGSSRRRWLYMMEEAEGVTVDEGDLIELFEWMVGLAAGRPTQPSS